MKEGVIVGPKVLKSAAGYYIGREIIEGDTAYPYDRLSGYYNSEEEAREALLRALKEYKNERVEGLMSLTEINRKYENIMNSNLSQYEKAVKLGELMSLMEGQYTIPALKDPEWEQENKKVIALYRKISISRDFDS